MAIPTQRLALLLLIIFFPVVLYELMGGACSVSAQGVSFDCSPDTSDSFYCSFDIVSSSTGQLSSTDVGIQGGLNHSVIPPEDYSMPLGLTPLPGGCSDDSSCVTIDDVSFLVDWQSVPDWFSYVGSDGQTYSKPQDEPTDPDDGSGGSDGGNDSGGSTGGRFVGWIG